MSSESWKVVKEFQDIKYEKLDDGIAKITINRPHVRNAFRPETTKELIEAFMHVREDSTVGCILFTGEGDKAFCSGGDQSVRGHAGYVGEDDGVARLNILDVQRLIRTMPKPVIALVAGYAIGGGHVLHVVWLNNHQRRAPLRKRPLCDFICRRVRSACAPMLSR